MLNAITLWALFAGELPFQNDFNSTWRIGLFDAQIVPKSNAKTVAPSGITFTKDGKRLLAWGEDQFVTSWQLTGGRIDTNKSAIHYRWPFFRDSFGTFLAGAISSDSKWGIFSGNATYNNECLAVNLETHEIFRIPWGDKENKRYSYSTIAFQDKQSRIILGRSDGKVEIRTLKEGFKALEKQTYLETGNNSNSDVVFLKLDEKQEKLFVIWRSGAWSLFKFEKDSVVEMSNHEKFEKFKLYDVRFADISSDFSKIIYTGANIENDEKKIYIVDFVDGKHMSFYHRAKADIPQKLQNIVFLDENMLVATYNLYSKTDYSFESTKLVFASTKNISEPQVEEQNSLFLPEEFSNIAVDAQNKTLALSATRKPGIQLIDFSGKPKIIQKFAPKHLHFEEIQVSNEGDKIVLKNHDENSGWLEFNLVTKKIRKQMAEPADWAKPILHKEGWSVKNQPDRRKMVIQNGNQEFILSPIAGIDDGYIQCFSFLPTKDLQIALGHRKGVSVLRVDVSAGKLYPIKYIRCHQNDVISVTPSKDGQVLYTCGNDFTIAASSLKDLPHHPVFGAELKLQKDEIVVNKVHPYSPAWLLGLDEEKQDSFSKILSVKVLSKNLELEANKDAETRKEILKILRNPPIGFNIQIQHERRRKGLVEKPKPEQTRCLVRPVWKMMISEDLEWVMYRWMDMYYDSSPMGESLIEWAVFDGPNQSVQALPANAFIKKFKKPDYLKFDVLQELLGHGDKLDASLKMPDLIPPKVDLKLEPTKNQKQLDVAMVVTGNGDDVNTNGKLKHVFLYRDDYLVQKWDAKDGAKIDLPKSVSIPVEKLRTGKNEIRLVAETNGGIRGEKKQEFILEKPPEGRAKPKMHSFAVGISDYKKVKAGKLTLENTKMAEDCKNFHELVKKRAAATNRYVAGHSKILVDDEVKEKKVISELAQFRNVIENPDDLLICLISGHGVPGDHLGKKDSKNKHYFPCHDFDHESHEETALDADEIIGPLEQLPCRKLIIYNACYSGLAAEWYNDFQKHVNPVMMFCAALKNQQAEFYEPKIRESVHKITLFSKVDHVKDMHGIFNYFVMGYIFGNDDKKFHPRENKDEMSLHDLYLLTKEQIKSDGKFNHDVILYGEDKAKDIVLASR